MLWYWYNTRYSHVPNNQEENFIICSYSFELNWRFLVAKAQEWKDWLSDCVFFFVDVSLTEDFGLHVLLLHAFIHKRSQVHYLKILRNWKQNYCKAWFIILSFKAWGKDKQNKLEALVTWKKWPVSLWMLSKHFSYHFKFLLKIDCKITVCWFHKQRLTCSLVMATIQKATKVQNPVVGARPGPGAASEPNAVHPMHGAKLNSQHYHAPGQNTMHLS